MSAAIPIDELRAQFIELADQDFAGYCPIYDRLARALSGDTDALACITEHRPGSTRTAVLLLGATHDLVLQDPGSGLAAIYRGDSDADPWPEFRALLLGRAADIATTMRTRTTQTNEVGRSANLLAVYASVSRALTRHGDDRPLSIIEIGPSAGLNLLADRFHVEYVRGDSIVSSAGRSTSPVHLRCELLSDTHFPGVTGMHEIVGRGGVDPAPVDITDPADARWLRACVWPGVPDRPERLAAAIDLARQDPPRLLRGDAVADLGEILRSVPDDVFPIVTSTWVLAYLPREDRTQVCALIDEIGASRDLAFVTGEAASVTPWIPPIDAERLPPGAEEGTPTVFGVRLWLGGQSRTWAPAVCHPHGRWMAWLEDEPPTEEPHG